MAVIEYRGQRYALAPDESVLDGLLRNGVAAAHSCKAGSCGSCMMRAETGALPAAAQAGLKDSWKAQRYFLPCVCLPSEDMALTPAGTDARQEACIASLEPIGAGVLRVRLTCGSTAGYRAGQYVSLLRGGSLARSYSIAAVTGETGIELHVRRIPGGRMSGWLYEQARPGDTITVTGPSGDCFYVSGKPEQPLLLAGTGTGLAPLFGILNDALRHGHHGPIHLFHGGLHESGLYLVPELQALAATHPQLTYIRAVLNGIAGEGVVVGSIEQVVLERVPKPAGWRGYVCGDPAIVRTLKKKLFLAGMASREIYADAFLPSAETKCN